MKERSDDLDGQEKGEVGGKESRRKYSNMERKQSQKTWKERKKKGRKRKRIYN